MDKVVITKNALIINSSKGSITIDPSRVIAVTTEIDDFDWRYSEKKPFQEIDKKLEYSIYIYHSNDGCSLQVKCSDEQEMNDIYSQVQQHVFGYQHPQQPAA